MKTGWELGEVSGERDVWVSLLSLLPCDPVPDEAEDDDDVILHLILLYVCDDIVCILFPATGKKLNTQRNTKQLQNKEKQIEVMKDLENQKGKLDNLKKLRQKKSNHCVHLFSY
ncbi:hypothetical protein AMECASPLE_039749 [Ameca splendens]|uniref:Uncharacterized protein n=1 Tax=Ameca splendens TaxID=208324 RepID=A0ABV1A6J3_9TELE